MSITVKAPDTERPPDPPAMKHRVGRCNVHATDWGSGEMCPLCPRCTLPGGPCVNCQAGNPCPDWAKAQSEADERAKAKLEEIAARFGVVKLVETDRWWQAFCAALPYWQSSTGDAPQPSVAAANDADLAIAEAKERGRL